MALELPARVEAVADAIVVDFPWDAATAALSALGAASSRLDSQLGTRPDMIGTLDDWVGTFRNEFDDSHQRLTSTASGIKDALTNLASSIVTGAETANQQQRQNNSRVEDPGQVPV
jgi:uncharacterized protein YukE